MSVLQATPDEVPSREFDEEHLAQVIALVQPHEHTWALRDIEYDNGFSLNRFECESCSAVRFT